MLFVSQVCELAAFCRDNNSRLIQQQVSSIDQEKSLVPKGSAKTRDESGSVKESGTAKKLGANDFASTKNPDSWKEPASTKNLDSTKEPASTKNPDLTKDPASAKTPSESASAGEGKKSSVEDEYDNLDNSEKAPVFSLSRITTVEQLVGFYLMCAQIYGFQFGLSIFFAGIILLAKNKKKVAYILIGYGALCAIFGFSAISLKTWLLEEKGEKSERVKQQSYEQSQGNGVSN